MASEWWPAFTTHTTAGDSCDDDDVHGGGIELAQRVRDLEAQFLEHHLGARDGVRDTACAPAPQPE